MNADKKFVVRCRAIIVKDGKLLIVRHAENPDFAALPGGHLEWGEDVKECLRRELIEELGVEPQIGRLLYVNTFLDDGNVQPMEFFFEVTNAEEYEDVSGLPRTHAHELASIEWIDPSTDAHLRPVELVQDLKEGKLISDEVRYLKS